MFAKLFAGAALAAALLAATGASAGLTHDYELNGDLHDAAGGADILNRAGAGSLGATGITFGADLGPTIGGYDHAAVYSVELLFSLDKVTGYNSIVEPKDIDANLYVVGGGLQFFPYPMGPLGQIAPGDLVHVVLTRDASGLGAAYLNGVLQLTFNDIQPDGSNRAVIDSELHFFNDDAGENSSGFVDYIRTYDVALDQDQVTTLARGGRIDFGPPGVPEPASWGLMILGFGVAGGLLRRRRGLGAVAA